MHLLTVNVFLGIVYILNMTYQRHYTYNVQNSVIKQFYSTFFKYLSSLGAHDLAAPQGSGKGWEAGGWK